MAYGFDQGGAFYDAERGFGAEGGVAEDGAEVEDFVCVEAGT